MSVKIKLDHGGMAEILNSSQVRGLVRDRAEVAAAMVPADQGVDYPDLLETTTDRPHFVIRCFAAAQAKYGTLTRAAAGAGLDVNAR